MNNKMKDIVVRFLFPITVLFFWEIIITVLDTLKNNFLWTVLLPKPSHILFEVFHLMSQQSTLLSIYVTSSNCLLGFCLGLFLALLIGAIIGSSSILYKLITPTLHFLRSLPAVLYLPIGLLFFGAGVKIPIFLAALITMLYGILPVVSAIRDYDREKIILLESNSFSKLKIFVLFIFPEIFNALTISISISITLALAVTIFSEMLLPSLGGIGSLILNAKEASRYETFWAYTVLAGSLGFIIHFLAQKLWQTTIPWAEIHNKGRMSNDL